MPNEAVFEGPIEPGPLQFVQEAPAPALSFNVNDNPCLCFHTDGRITLSPNAKPDEMARRVIDIVADLWAQHHKSILGGTYHGR